MNRVLTIARQTVQINNEIGNCIKGNQSQAWGGKIKIPRRLIFITKAGCFVLFWTGFQKDRSLKRRDIMKLIEWEVKEDDYQEQV